MNYHLTTHTHAKRDLHAHQKRPEDTLKETIQQKRPTNIFTAQHTHTPKETYMHTKRDLYKHASEDKQTHQKRPTYSPK